MKMNTPQKDFKFDKRATSYDDGFEGRFSKKFYLALLSQVTLRNGFAVLDVGCGTGQLLKVMSEAQDIIGFGIDVEQEMINVAKAKCPNMTIQVSACEKTPFIDASFDVVTACMAYHHFSNKIGFIKEAARILKTGGYLYIADPRFPFPIRKTLNGMLKLLKITGKFFASKEMANDFGCYGFSMEDVFYDGIVQIIKLRKTEQMNI